MRQVGRYRAGCRSRLSKDESADAVITTRASFLCFDSQVPFAPSGAWHCVSWGPDQDQGYRAIRAQPAHTLWIDRCRVTHSVDDLHSSRSTVSGAPAASYSGWNIWSNVSRGALYRGFSGGSRCCELLQLGNLRESAGIRCRTGFNMVDNLVV